MRLLPDEDLGVDRAWRDLGGLGASQNTTERREVQQRCGNGLQILLLLDCWLAQTATVRAVILAGVARSDRETRADDLRTSLPTYFSSRAEPHSHPLQSSPNIRANTIKQPSGGKQIRQEKKIREIQVSQSSNVSLLVNQCTIEIGNSYNGTAIKRNAV